MNKKPQILFLLHIPPPVHGSSVVGLSIKESSIINQCFINRYINLLASEKVAESGIINLRKLLGFVKTLSEVLGSIFKNRPNLCYIALTVTGAAFFRDFILICLIKLFRIKLIYHLHNKGVEMRKHRFLYRICYRYVFNNADVILLSELLYPDIKSYVPKSKVHFCPNGIKDSEVTTRIHIKNTKNKPTKLLFLSNLLESKGVFVLLDACKILQEKGHTFECTFIGCEGDISSSEFYDKVSQLGLNNEVSYQGVKQGYDKMLAFASTDIFVFPTYYETFGLVNIEAMQHAKPVISTFEGGIPDVVEDGVTGFLVPKKDASALAEKLEILIKDEQQRIAMGIAGRKKYEQQFTQEIFESKLHEILKTVAKS